MRMLASLAPIFLVVALSPATLRPQAIPDSNARPARSGWERRVKVGASTLAGIPSFGVERRIADPKGTVQWDVIVSPWASVNDEPFQFAVGTLERRAYTRTDASGWFAGLHLGVGAFRMQRWDYSTSQFYSEGANFMAGGSVGRVWRVRNGWSVEAHVGGGTVQSMYKSYDRVTGERLDGAKLWNISGEWLPYRSSLSVGVPLGRRDASVRARRPD